MTKKVDISRFAWKGPSLPGPDVQVAANRSSAAPPKSSPLPPTKGLRHVSPQQLPIQALSAASSLSAPYSRVTIQPKAVHPAKRSPSDVWKDGDAVEQWKNLSRILQGARRDGVQLLTNPELLKAAGSDPKTDFAPLYVLWAMDNCLMAGMHEDALAVAEELERRWPDHTIDGTPLLEEVLRKASRCQRVLGRFDLADAALERLSRLKSSFGQDEAWPWYERGLLAEELGDINHARVAYQEAARRRDRPGRGDGLNCERARRNAKRLCAGQTWARPEPEGLAKELVFALLRRDERRLEALASRTHFSLGVPHGERLFADRSLVLASLAEDLRLSKLRVEPEALGGRGGKRYLICDGWQGRVFFGRVLFMLDRVPGGWEWNGVASTVASTEGAELFRKVFGEGQPMENQDLAIPIKAPWPAPIAMQAGGIGDWGGFAAGETAAVATAVGAAIAAFAAAGPFAGVCAAVAGPAAAFATLATFQAIRLGISSSRPCGWGPGGFYYNEFTHAYGMPLFPASWDFAHNEQFAVDFARYPRGTTRDENITGGVEVLAVADGIVTDVNDTGARGTSTLNFVTQKLVPVFAQPLSLVRYTAKYLHLDGPDKLLVSRNQWVDQGFVLGFVDDTGTSVWDHLHFQIQDRLLRADRPRGLPSWIPWSPDPDGRTTRPTPIDREQTLRDGEHGKCIVSSNRITNPAAYVAFLQALAGGRPLVISPRDPQRAEIHRDVFARSAAPDPQPGPERCGLPGLLCCASSPGRPRTWCITGRCDRGVCR